MFILGMQTNVVLAANDFTYCNSKQEIAWKDFDVYEYHDWKNKIGRIGILEGFTQLEQNGPEGWLWIEYSTSNGAKRGYIQIPVDELGMVTHECVAKVTKTTTLYYGPDTSAYHDSGTVYAGEYVAIMGKNGNWAYVEYNTTSGRKRGYMVYSNLYTYGGIDLYWDYPVYKYAPENNYINERKAIYSGPTTRYPIIGYVDHEEVKSYYKDNIVAIISGNPGCSSEYVEYKVDGTNKKKSGFILWGQ